MPLRAGPAVSGLAAAIALFRPGEAAVATCLPVAGSGAMSKHAAPLLLRPSRCPRRSARGSRSGRDAQLWLGARSVPALARRSGSSVVLAPARRQILLLAPGEARASSRGLDAIESRPQQEPASRCSALMLPIWMRKRCRRVDLDGGRCRILADRQSGYGRGANWPPVQKRHRRGVLLARHWSPAPSERAVWNNSLSRCSDRPGTRPLPRLNHPAALPGARATLMPPADLVLESRPRRATMLT